MSVEEVIERIDEERRRRGMSVAEMCHKALISPGTFYSWLKCDNSPTLAAVVLLVDSLGLKLTVTKG